MVIESPSQQQDEAPPHPDGVHGSFEVSLVVPTPPPRTFQAYADLDLRRRWFRIPGPAKDSRHELDFRIGGHELAEGSFAPMPHEDPEPERIAYRSTFLDIVPERRIILAYTVDVGPHRSASMVTLEFHPDPEGTHLRHTEQYVLLTPDESGDHAAHLRGSTRLQFNGLLAELRV